tara:strand:- start:1101 stop:1391 length:291 start_codon:yes stop_codon:yes gene_type:complete
MANISQTDLIVRLQLLGCKYGELSSTFANNLKFGRKCAKTEWKKLILLGVYISILEDYHINDTVNCLTELQLSKMLEKASKLTDICFKPYGFNYTT